MTYGRTEPREKDPAKISAADNYQHMTYILVMWKLTLYIEKKKTLTNDG